MNFSDFYKVIPREVKHRVNDITRLIQEFIPKQSQSLASAVEHALLPGGKRIRPVFLYLTYLLRGNHRLPETLERCALVLELMHTATLVHDDIIDNSSMRRGKETVNTKYGLPRSILVGDYLLTRAFGICSDLPYIIRKFTEDCAINLIVGENDELDELPSAPFERVFRILTLKTASMFSLAAKCASFFSNDDPECIELAGSFGTLCGQAFQILDDLLDFLGSPETTGKPSFIDLKERKPSSVIHFWIMTGSPLSTEYIENFDSERIHKYAEDVLKSGAIQETVKLLKLKVTEGKNLCLMLNRNPDIYGIFEIFFDCFDKQFANSEFLSIGVEP